MSKHTPAPWYDDGYRIYAPVTPEGTTVSLALGMDPREGRIIVEYKHREGFNEADAALIRAAPELLAALEMIADMQDDPATMRVKAREAIAKVRAA